MQFATYFAQSQFHALFVSFARSEQADQISEMQLELREARTEAEMLREEHSRLADAAIAARHWRDEADAGRQATAQVAQLERTCDKLRQRLDAAQYYKVRNL